MNKFKFILLSFVIFNLSFVITAPTDAVTISSGGAAETGIINIIGEPLIGPISGGGGIGGIYTYVFTTEVSQLSLDNGLIQNTIISKSGKNPNYIKITFTAKNNSVTMADVWRLSGPGVEFTTDTSKWGAIPVYSGSKVIPGVTTIWDEELLMNSNIPLITAANGSNAYYRVVPTGTDQKDLFGKDKNGVSYNDKTVGKVDVPVTRNGKGISFYSFSIPLIPQTSVLFTDLFSSDKFVGIDPKLNKLNADQIREWAGDKWISYYKSTANKWLNAADDSDSNFTFCRGYVLRLQPEANPVPFYVTALGEVLSVQYQSDFQFGGTPAMGTLGGPVKFTAFGNPLPVTNSFDNAFTANIPDLKLLTGQNLLEADQLRHWDFKTGSWLSAYVDANGAWLNTSDNKPAFNLDIGQGYVFRTADKSNKGAFTWKY